MTTIQLEVAIAYPNDFGLGIARLDPDTLMHLRLRPGDLIKIEGNDMTAAQVWRVDRQDRNTDTVLLDGFTRLNAGVSIDERVEIRRVETTIADSLTLAPPEELPKINFPKVSLTLVSPEEASVQFGSDVAAMAERQVIKRPVVKHDIVPIRPDTNRPLMRSSSHAVPLIAVATEPNGVVFVTDETTVIIQEEAE